MDPALGQALLSHGANPKAALGANQRGEQTLQTRTAIADTIRAGSATISSRTSTRDLLRKLGAVKKDLRN